MRVDSKDMKEKGSDGRRERRANCRYTEMQKTTVNNYSDSFVMNLMSKLHGDDEKNLRSYEYDI
jgi:hypothetical protein